MSCGMNRNRISGCFALMVIRGNDLQEQALVVAETELLEQMLLMNKYSYLGIFTSFGVAICFRWILAGFRRRKLTMTPTRRCKLKKIEVLESKSEIAKHRGYRNIDIATVIKKLVDENALGIDVQPVAICYDMDALKETLRALKDAFPGNFTHCIAIKSNPLPFFLKFAVQMGCGLEAASYAEALLALRTGCPADKIMFDSPAKTRADIRFALEHNIQINADNFFELDRIAEERRKLEDAGYLSGSVIGLRINPLVGEGKIKALSVSDESSKFGIPLTAETKKRVFEYFHKLPWLAALHCHVGSQGCTLSQHAQGAKRLYELCEEINGEVGSRRIRRMDIGGGLPVNFDSEEISPTFDVYARTLREEVPSLFRGDLTVITEYGRSVSAKAAWAACSVEYIKTVSTDHEIAVIQAGADLFLRTCYAPSNFSLRVTGHHRQSGKELQPHADGIVGGNEVSRRMKRYDVAGPLCFGGDKITVNRPMPQLLVGDFVVVHDVGANTLSMFSRHCSRQAPPVYGYCRSQEAEGVEVALIKEMEPVEDVLRFWS